MSPVTYLPGTAPRPSCGPADPRVVTAIEQLLARARMQAAEEVRLDAERQAEEIDDPSVETFAA